MAGPGATFESLQNQSDVYDVDGAGLAPPCLDISRWQMASFPAATQLPHPNVTALSPEGRQARQKTLGVASQIRQKVTCPHCLDKTTAKLLSYMETKPLQASHTLWVLLTTLQPTSASVKRHHLLAQETKPTKSRTQAMAPGRIAAWSYRMASVKRARRRSNYLERQVIKKYGFTMKQYRRILRGFSAQKVRRGGGESDRQLQDMGKKAKRKTSAWNEYKAEKLSTISSKVSGTAFKEELRKIAGEWQRIKTTPASNVYHARAAATTQKRNHVVDKADDIQDMSRCKRQRCMSDLAARVCKELHGDESFTKFGLGSFSSALRPALVDTTTKQADIERAFARAFRYDSKPVPNPRGIMQPVRSCHIGNFGVCRGDRHSKSVNNLSFNLYAILRARHIGKNEAGLSHQDSLQVWRRRALFSTDGHGGHGRFCMLH